jgi:hypothetical protein
MTGVVYFVPVVQPVVPFVAGVPMVLKQITDPVEVEIVTDWVEPYVPATGEKVGVEALGKVIV